MRHKRSFGHDVRGHEAALFRASYYRWCAARGHALAGGDPLTGRPRRSLTLEDAAEGRAAYLTLARHWLGVARARRSSTEGRLP